MSFNIFYIFAAFGNFDELSKSCDSPDLDPLDGCLPVDCHKKYNGNKNYFCKSKKLCVKVPPCYSDPHKDMPDVVSKSAIAY